MILLKKCSVVLNIKVISHSRKFCCGSRQLPLAAVFHVLAHWCMLPSIHASLCTKAKRVLQTLALAMKCFHPIMRHVNSPHISLAEWIIWPCLTSKGEGWSIHMGLNWQQGMLVSSTTVRGTTDQNHLPWPGPTVTTCMSYLTTGGPGKEHGTNKLPPTRRIWERSKGERRHQPICPTNLPGFFSLESILAEPCTRHREGPWVRVIGQRQPGN